MKSIAFPNMFKGNSTETVPDFEATRQNALLVLRSEKGTFEYDPYFGLRLKRYLFEQNNYILRDVIIDEIYTQLATFMPQLRVNRRDITIISDNRKGKLYCRFKAANIANYEVDTYQLVLYQEDDQK